MDIIPHNIIHKKKIKGAVDTNKMVLYINKKDLDKVKDISRYFIADVLITDIKARKKGKHNGEVLTD